MREFARVQGFGDDFVFRGSVRMQYYQIGNTHWIAIDTNHGAGLVPGKDGNAR